MILKLQTKISKTPSVVEDVLDKRFQSPKSSDREVRTRELLIKRLAVMSGSPGRQCPKACLMKASLALCTEHAERKSQTASYRA